MEHIYSCLEKLGKIRLLTLLWVLCLCFPSVVYGGEDDVDSLPFKDRIAIKTNVVDWLLVAPNIAFDYDLVNTPYDKKSIGVGVKYNWNTTHTYIPKRVYNFFDLRFDYRFHWRPQPYDDREETSDWERTWLKTSKGFDKLKARMNCFRGAENPKSHISIFVGPYASFSTFSIKLGADDKSLGRQGLAAGAGLTAGVALPLYGYEDGTAVDLEFGGSLGWHFAAYDLYTADVDNNCYLEQGHENKFVYYPFVSDLRVSLVYRFRSIRKQHTEVDYDLLDRRFVNYQMMLDRDETEKYNATIKSDKYALDGKNRAIRDYKMTEEAVAGFDSTFCLEYLQPYVLMQDAPKGFTRYNKDTVAKVHIDSIGQITDPLLLDLRAYIDSIPGIKGSDIDYLFVKKYNELSDDDSKEKVNRTALIRNIYSELNEYYIKPSNAKLVAGHTVMKEYSEKVQKHNSKTQRREITDIVYVDSVREAVMTDNERIEWMNAFKKKAWEAKKQRMAGNYIGRRSLPAADTLAVQMDSVKMDSLAISLDSLAIDSMAMDSLTADSLRRVVLDSVMVDSMQKSISMPDSIAQPKDSTNAAVDSLSVMWNSPIREDLYNNSVAMVDLIAMRKTKIVGRKIDEE